MQTYWLSMGNGPSNPRSAGTSESASETETDLNGDTNRRPSSNQQGEKTPDQVKAEKSRRLVEWNVDVLHRLLKHIVALRKAQGRAISGPDSFEYEVRQFGGSNSTVIDEVKEIITLPPFDAKAASSQEEPDSVVLDKAVVDQLYDFVDNVAGMYRENEFHVSAPPGSAHLVVP